MLPLLLLTTAASVAGHGSMVWPPIWQDGGYPEAQNTLATRFDTNIYSDPVVVDPKTNKRINRGFAWLTDQSYLGGHGEEFKGVGNVTNLDRNSCPKWPCQGYKAPWASPGRAPSFGGGCGIHGGNPFGCPAGNDNRPAGAQCGDGRPGQPKRGAWTYGSSALDLDFPQAQTTEWKLGSTQEVALMSRGGHKGGYTYRLCSLDLVGGKAGLTEECFARNVLEFANQVTMHKVAGKNHKNAKWIRYPQTDLRVGTDMWRPIGTRRAIGDGLIRKDKVLVPGGLAPGEYVLSWRWDMAGGGQVWVSCANIRLVQP
jgi:hypothetical protein